MNVTQSGQGISHVLTKGSQGNVQTAAHLVGARVIPVVSSATAGKQALQVNIVLVTYACLCYM